LQFLLRSKSHSTELNTDDWKNGHSGSLSLRTVCVGGTDDHEGIVNCRHGTSPSSYTWHDNGWSDHVCKAPSANTYCPILRGIAASKTDQEDEIAGTAVTDL
jgi:hypothetical protein